MKSKLIILGCGSSVGVPRIDGQWGSCDKNNKKNKRTRCSAIIIKGTNSILIDTSPDLRTQLLSNKIKTGVDALWGLGLNKAIGSIPFLGKILVGKNIGEGVFGVSFKIKGSPKDLKTTVNPIKTLTPRFITRTLEKIKKN